MRLLEPFAGSAAVSMRALGLHTLCPYVGGKGFSSERILELLGMPVGALPDQVVLNDSGAFGRFWSLCSPGLLREAARLLRSWEGEPPFPRDRELFDRLRGTSPSSLDDVAWLATFLFLQARTFRGKPIWELHDDGGWKTHGFDPEYRDTLVRTSKKTHNRGWASPRGALARRLDALADACTKTPILGLCRDAPRVLDLVQAGDMVFLDPPYGQWTDYGPRSMGISSSSLWMLALECQARGATVVLAHDDLSVLPKGEVFQAPSRRSGRLQAGNAPRVEYLIRLERVSPDR